MEKQDNHDVHCICDAEEHDEMYECAVCGKCCFAEPMVKERHQTYEEKATCLDCAMKIDDEEIECQCDACKLVRGMQEKNYAHYLCKSANQLTQRRTSN